jgi:hypothetical protein
VSGTGRRENKEGLVMKESAFMRKKRRYLENKS